MGRNTRLDFLNADEHFPQHLVQGQRLKPLGDKRIQWDNAVGDLGRKVRLGEQRQGPREVDFADHPVGRDDTHFTRHHPAQRQRYPPCRNTYLQERAATAYRRERLLYCGGGAGGFDRQVHTPTAGEFEDLCLCELIGFDERGGKCAQSLGQISLALAHLHDDEREVALCSGEQRGQQEAADTAEAEKCNALTGLDADATKGMHRHRARLCQRRSFIAAALRHSHAHAGRHLHLLSESPVRVDAIEHRALADIGAPGLAGRTRAAPHARTRHHPLPDVQAGHSSPNCQDDAHELMTQDDRPLVPAHRMGLVQRDPFWPHEKLGYIGSAQRSQEWGKEHFVRPGRTGFGNLLDAHGEWAMIDGCFHAGSFSFFSLFTVVPVSRHNVSALSLYFLASSSWPSPAFSVAGPRLVR